MIPNQNVITEEQKQIILDKHNELRRKVAKGQETQGSNGPQPAASNMKEMVYSGGYITSVKIKKPISPTIKQKIPLILVPNESSCSLVSKNGPGSCFCANID